MIGFNYEYTSSFDIMNNIKLISEYSYIEYIILILSIIIIIILIYYIIPNISHYFSTKKEEREKKRKQKILKQIIIQKDINDEIEKELNI